MKEKGIEIIARGVMVRGGKLLVCRNRKKARQYLPGGHLEFNESAKDALHREIREEMGLASAIGRFLGASEHTFVVKGERTCEINLVFEMTVRGMKPGRPAPSREKKIEFLWVPLNRLGRARMEPRSLAKVLPQWLKPSAQSGWASRYGR